MKKFSFGKNWKKYLKHFDDTRLRVAQKSLVRLTGRLKGKTFIDVGCGSGIFSLAAWRAGAKKVISFDVDSASVACARYLWRRAGRPTNWQIKKLSALDKKLIAKVGRGEVVYSWGVLHHTGAMERAFDQVAQLVKPGGKLVIAIYNKTGGGEINRFWWWIKYIYNNGGLLVRQMLLVGYGLAFLVGKLLLGENPIREIRGYSQHRGMRWKEDVVDWLGGFPYEYATAKVVKDFFRQRDFRVLKIVERGGIACNDFVFRKLS